MEYIIDIDIDIQDFLQNRSLNEITNDVAQKFKLEQKHDILTEALTLVDEKILNKLYRQFNQNGNDEIIAEDINGDNYLKIDDILFDNSYKNQYLSNFDAINSPKIKNIITDTVKTQIDLDVTNNIIPNEIAIKMKQELPNVVEKYYNKAIHKLKNIDSKLEHELQSNFKNWTIAYNSRNLEEMQNQAKQISANIKQYINSNKGIVSNAMYIVSKTEYLKQKIKKSNEWKLSEQEETLLKNLIEDNLKVQIPSDELEADINKYAEIASNEALMNEQELKELKQLENKIRKKAKEENYDEVKYLFGDLDLSELEQILKELEEGVKK